MNYPSESKTATINNGRSLAPCQSSPNITLNPSVFGLVICLISVSGAVEHFSSGEVETTCLLVSHCLEKVIRGALKHHPPPPPIIGFVWEIVVRLIKRLKCTQTAIKVYIPHKELCLSCFLILSSPMNAILVSFNVLVSQLLRRRQGKRVRVPFQERKIFGLCSSEGLKRLEWKKSNFCSFFFG